MGQKAGWGVEYKATWDDNKARYPVCVKQYFTIPSTARKPEESAECYQISDRVLFSELMRETLLLLSYLVQFQLSCAPEVTCTQLLVESVSTEFPTAVHRTQATV